MSTETLPITKRLLRTKDAAAYLGISPCEIRSLAQGGDLPYIQLAQDGPWTFDVRDLDAYIDQKKSGR